MTPREPVRNVSVPLPVKIVVSGGFGVGKTTFVASISEITPLTTEAPMTEVAVGIDEPRPGKLTTTVAMDFGRITLGDDLILYLFGTPGQDRFQFMWDELVRGAIGAVVLVDSMRLADCFPSVDYYEQLGIPFVVALNTFDGLIHHRTDDVREALDLRASVPMFFCDARERLSTKQALMELVQHAMTQASQTL